tara:strand:- start:1628 stop:2089 length:462 start_codon:yes stop_codon:yes gene_type:complete
MKNKKTKKRQTLNFNKKVVFSKPKDVGNRLWGKETLLVMIPKILSLKMLTMKKGSKGGLQYHHKKNECGYILKGKLCFRYVDIEGKLKKKILQKGDSFHIPPGAIHQEEALSRCEIIEASTPHFNDRVRVEKYFGLEIEQGLKTTKKNEVILK